MKVLKKTNVVKEINTPLEYLEFAVELKIFKELPKVIIKSVKKRINSILSKNNELSSLNFRKSTLSIFEFKRNNMSEYWVERGYTKKEAKNIISNNASKAAKTLHASRTPEERKEFAKKANTEKQKYLNDLKLSNPAEYKAQFNTNIEYYIAKGLTPEEAIVALKKRQGTFSLDKLKHLHGEKKAIDLLDKRNSKWMDSLKKNNDWDELSKKKGRTREELVLKFGEEKANQIIYDRVKNSTGFREASKESLLVFTPLISWLIEIQKIFIMDDIQIGSFGKEEFLLRNDKGQFMFSYDFTIEKLKIIIEYNGEAFHPNPEWDKETWDYWSLPYNKEITADLKRFADINKIGKANSLGYSVLELWSSKSPEENLEIAKNFIMKYI